MVERAHTGRSRATRTAIVAVVLAVGLVVGIAGAAPGDTTVDFEQYGAGTVLTTQYGGAGGTGQGVVFGPLPGGAGDGLRPMVRIPGPAQGAHSGTHVADIATCLACEFFTPRTTATLATPRSVVSVYVGFLGDPAPRCSATNTTPTGCAVVTLRAFNAAGAAVGESSVLVTRGGGVTAPLSVTAASPSIAGFEITGRHGTDDTKSIAIDDLTFGSPGPPAPPDFTLNPTSTSLSLEQGETRTVPVTIGRLNGSTGGVSLAAPQVDGLDVTFAPNPAPGAQTVMTLAAAPTAGARSVALTVTGAPQAATAGTATRSFPLSVTIAAACPHVATVEQLAARVKQRFRCIYVDDAARIDLASPHDPAVTDEEAELVIPDGTTLMGGRSPTVEGGVVEMTHRTGGKIMLKLGSNTRVSGLRLLGYNPSDRRYHQDGTRAISIPGSTGVVVSNNEIANWPHSGVYVTGAPAERSSTARVTRNFIHNNLQCSEGQGVQIGGNGFARIDHNLFDFNRHDVGSIGGPGQGYDAEWNFSLTSGPKCNPGDVFQYYNQHYDMHGQHGGYGGIAGTLMEIRHNTIRGAQPYGINHRPAFWLRGTPQQKAVFAGNVVHASDALGGDGAVRVSGSIGLVQAMLKTGKLVISGNHLCVDTAAELGVGDFDGDGHDDVFQSVGTLWVYSPRGAREWHALNDSTVRLAALGIGDFDGDGRTDVFSQAGDRWSVSRGGTATPVPLPAGSNIPIRQYRFHDFDGDGKTDVFRTNGTRFFLSSAGATAWRPLVASRLSLADLRFGDFDADGRTDVFSISSGQWSVSYGGSGPWRRLNAKLASSPASLVFGDFDGDRRTDVARSSGGNWQVSSGGAKPWRTLQHRRAEQLAFGTLVGDFNGDGRDDVLQHAERATTPALAAPCWAAPGKPSSGVSSLDYFRVSSGAANPFVRWSSAKMR